MRKKQSETGIRKRIPLRRRFVITVLLTTVLSIIAVSVVGFLSIRWIRSSAKENLIEQLELNRKEIIQAQAVSIDAKLDHYRKYIELFTDTIDNLYANEEEMISSGRMFYAPKDTREYELTRAFASSKLTEEELQEEIYLFSHLESIWAPIARENEDLVTRIHLGTESGLLISYDRYSYLSCPPEGKTEVVNNYHVSEWYKRGMKEEDIFVSGVYMDSQSHGLTITIGRSFRNSKGENAGVVCMDFDLDALYEELFSANTEDGMFIFAMDHENKIISPDSDTLVFLQYTGLTLDEMDALQEDADGIMEKEDLIYISIPIEQVGWTLCARVPMSAIQGSLNDTDRSIQTIIFIFLGIVVVILAVAVFLVNRSVRDIIKPLELLERDIKIISDGDLDYRAAVYRNDEIGDITSRMNEMVDRLNFTMKELMSSQQHADAMSRLATRDTLTGVRNKTAFDGQMKLLSKELDMGEKAFGFAMMDLNNLKLINDNFGHEKGDIAIKKVSGIICRVFAHSPVFRVGGDEFVAILKNDDYKNIESLTNTFMKEIADCSAEKSLEPWERVSVAIGYALYDEEIDQQTDSVLARADKEMYACKKKMKGIS